MNLMKVHRLPKSVTLPDSSVIVNPTEAQCNANGIFLYTPEELQQIEESRLQAERDRLQEEQTRQLIVEELRIEYARTTLALCELGDIDPPVAKFEDAGPIQEIYEGIMSGLADESDPAVILQILAKASRAQALAQALQLLITELRRFDGDDAWERIPDHV